MREQPVAEVGEAVRDRERAVPDVHVVTIDDGVDALPRERFKSLWFGRYETLRARGLEHGARERMLRSQLGTGDEPERLFLAVVGAGEDVGHFRPADRERA